MTPDSTDSTMAAPEPMIVARGLGLQHGSGWAYRGVDLEVPPACVVALVGPQGSGRSALLLTLAGRMRPTDGALAVAGIDARSHPAAVRTRTAVARLADVVVLEEELTVADTVAERCLIDGVRPRTGRAAFHEACERAGVSLRAAAHVGGLSAVDRTLLALLVTAVRPADVVVLDDTDAGVTTDGEREIYRVAAALASSGPVVVTATTRTDALSQAVHVLDLAAGYDDAATADGAPAAEGAPPAPGSAVIRSREHETDGAATEVVADATDETEGAR